MYVIKKNVESVDRQKSNYLTLIRNNTNRTKLEEIKHIINKNNINKRDIL